MDGLQERASLLEFGALGGAPQSIGTDFDKALGQDMAQETPDKFLGAHRDVFVLLRAVVAISERDLPVLETFQPAVADGDAKGIPTQIFQDLFSRKAGFFGWTHCCPSAESPPALTSK